MTSWCDRQFQRSSPVVGTVLVCCLLAGAQPAMAEMATGDYTGDGALSRNISGLGFQPAVVIVKGDLAEPGVIRPDFYLSGFSKQLCPPSLHLTDGILDFDADGFTVGSHDGVNRSGVNYHWVAFSADPGFLKTGFYFGDGMPDHWVFGVGFQPEILMVLPGPDEACQFRTIDMPDDYGTSFDSTGLYTNHVEYFAADCFRVGSDFAVNGFGQQYGYVAFNADAAKVVHGFYTGDGTPDHEIGPIGFGPEYVIVKSAESIPAVHRPKSLGDPWSCYFWSEGHYNEGIVDLKGDHFEVGSSDRVNESLKTFYYVAFNDVNAAADLEVTLVVDDPTPDVGQEVTFDVTLFNNDGPDNASLVTVDLDLPVGLTYTGDTPSFGTYDSGTGVWTVGDLDKNDTATLQVTATVDVGTDGQTLGTTAWVSGMDEADPDGTDNSASTDVVVNISASADLDLTASWSDTTPDEGQTVTVSFYMWNNGPDDATNITAQATLPAGLTYVSANPWWGTWDDATDTWSTASIMNGQMNQLDITATVDAGTHGQTLTATTTITGLDQFDPDGANNTVDAALTVNSADLQLTMSVDNATPVEGEDFTCFVDLVNNGPQDAHNLTVGLTLPAGLDYQSNTRDSGSYNSGQSRWTVPSLGAGMATQLRLVIRPSFGSGGQTLTTTGDITAVDEADPDTTNNAASVDVTVGVAPTADLALTCSVDDATPDEGQLVELQIRIDNFGPVRADNITSITTLPAGLTFDSAWEDNGTYDPGTGVWDLPVLWDNDHMVLYINATVDAGTNGQTLTIPSAITGADQFDPDLSNNSCDASLTVRSADLALAMTVDDPSPAEGQDISITVDLVNNGTDDATAIKADLTFPAGLSYQSESHDSGSYNAGQSYWTIPYLAVGMATQLRLVVRPDAGTAGQTLTTTGDITEVNQADPDLSNNSDSVDVTVDGTLADLTVALAVDDPAPDEGQQIVYTVDLANLGPADATGAAVTVTLPAGLTYIGDAPDAGTFDSGTGVWTVGPVTAPGTAQLLLTAQVDAGTGGATLTTTAAVSASDQSDPDAANNSASADVTVASADLLVAVAVDDPTPDEGQQVVYTIDLGNLGPSDATGAAVTVTLPAGLTYVSDTPADGTYDSGTGVWTVGPVPAFVSTQLQLTAQVDAGTGATTLTTTVAVSAADQSDPDPANNTDSIDVTVTSSDLAVAIAVDDPTPDEGQQITATIDLDNLGPSDATGTAVTVTLPAGLTYVSDTPGAGTYDNGTGVWTIGPVAALGTAQLQLTAQVDVGTGGATLSTNAVISAADQSDPDATNNAATVDAVVNVVPVADLELAAAFDITDPLPGDAVVLTVTLTNAGPDPATGIRVDVSLSPQLAVAAANADLGSWNALDSAWTLPALAPSATETLRLDLTVGAVAAGTELTGTATVAALDQVDPDPSDDTATATLTVQGPVAVLAVVEPFDEPDRTLLPGGAPDDVLLLELVNESAYSERLTEVTISNPVTGTFDQASQDAVWTGLEIWERGSPVPVLIPENAGVFVDGRLTFTGLDFVVPAADTLHLVVRGAVAVDTPDGVELQPIVAEATDLVFGGAVALQGIWPLVAPGTLAVDGMVAAQIALHPIGAEIFQMGSMRNVALDVTLPGNGGTGDFLTRLNVKNHGNADAGVVLSRTEAWADDGDGTFDAAADLLLGELIHTGDRWEVTGLWQPVGALGQRIFITVDVAEDALGGTVRLGLPAGDDTGVGMASGNDGPIDEPVINPFAQTVSATDRVIATSGPVMSRVLAPGEDGVPLLHLLVRNLYADTQTLTRLQVRNLTRGQSGATVAQRDAAISQLTLRHDGDGDGEIDDLATDPILGTAIFTDGVAVFDGLDWDVPTSDISYLLLSARTSLHSVADGDTLAAAVGGAGDLQFRDPVALVGGWPLDSGARHRVDGMVAAQIESREVPPVSLTANDGPVLALDLEVPGNGYLPDTLTDLQLVNTGSATTNDIADVRLWRDDGDGVFEPGGGEDTEVGTAAGVGQIWVAPDLDLAVPVGGLRLFAGVTVTPTPSDSVTVELDIPLHGITVASDNDGPRDVAVVNPTSLLISTAPLLSTLQTGQRLSVLGQQVTVTMDVENVSGETVVGIVPQGIMVLGTGSLELVSGPLPVSLDLNSGDRGTFTWTFTGLALGDVRLSGRCAGTGAVGGQNRHSLTSQSATHTILRPAEPVGVYPVANMPFSINRGQIGVVPLTLTLMNDSDDDVADVRLERIVMSLDDGEGGPIVPADLLSRASVNEGVNVYSDRTDLETSGRTVTLDLTPAVVVTNREPVSLGLRLNILSETSVRVFRVSIATPTHLTASDNISGDAVAVQLLTGTFPISSGTGTLVAQATGLQVAGEDLPDGTAGAGQDDVELLRLQLVGNGDDEFASEVEVGSFTVSITDTAGRRLIDAAARLERIQVVGPLAIHAEHALTVPDDSTVTFHLSPPITVPVGATPVAVSLRGRLPEGAVLGPFQIRLEDNALFDARDGNVGAPVGVQYEQDPISGPVLTVQAGVPALRAVGRPELPQRLIAGSTEVAALTLTLRHPGEDGTANVAVDTLVMQCVDADRGALNPAQIFEQIRLAVDGAPVLAFAAPAAEDGRITVPLDGLQLVPGASRVLSLGFDLETDTVAGTFGLLVAPEDLIAHDTNTHLPTPTMPEAGASVPFGSGMTSLLLAADEVQVAFTDRMPPLLATADEPIEMASLTLANPAVSGTGEACLTRLVVRAADADGQPVTLGAYCDELEIRAGETLWAEALELTAADTVVTLAGSAALDVVPGEPVTITVLARVRSDAPGGGLRLGLDEPDVTVVQPAGVQGDIRIYAAPGTAFPFWTLTGSLSAQDLASSYINFPNPFAAGREATLFAFHLAQPAEVTLRILTPRGEGVATLLAGQSLPAGLRQDLSWDGRNGRGQTVRNGVYLAELLVRYESGDSERLLRKVAVVR